jgi:DNA-binding transcriptional LysR family regulator
MDGGPWDSAEQLFTTELWPVGSGLVKPSQCGVLQRRILVAGRRGEWTAWWTSRAVREGSGTLAHAEGTLDAAFLSFPGPPPAGLTVRTLASVSMLALLPADHPLAQGPDVALADLADLADEPFVDSPVGYGNRAVVDHHLTAAGLQRHVSIEVTDVRTAADFVRQGLGVAVMPSFATPELDPHLAILPLADPPLHWLFYAATLSTRRPSAALRALLRLVDHYVHVPESGTAVPRLPA